MLPPVMTDNAAALLLLADGRLPAGGYAHSGGLEPMINAGRVHDLPTLELFLEGRARTAGAVAAAFAAAAHGALADMDTCRFEALDGELDARMPSPAQRATSRQLGRQLLRVLGAIKPHPALDDLGIAPHHPLALGAGAVAFGLGCRDAAAAALHESVAGPAAAAVRLLALDPFSTHAALARLTPLLDALAVDAVAASRGGLGQLSAAASPLLDLAAEEHSTQATRLFAS